MNRRNMPFLSAGLPSVLLVFVLLCMITFSALSLTSANADDRLSRQMAKRTQEYYAAEGAANRRLKEIDGLLLKIYNSSMTKEEYFRKVFEELEASEDVAVKEASGEILILFEEKIDETEALSIELAAVYPKERDGRYRILRWQTVQVAEWNPKRTLQVLE
ncbi:MAG: hypothetical protein Q4B57_07630 [Eubacteriales bacterium]|nr:hypothetical protein [Eubacteriales bacterium]